jgi:hypothetical protein
VIKGEGEHVNQEMVTCSNLTKKNHNLKEGIFEYKISTSAVKSLSVSMFCIQGVIGVVLFL